MAGPTIKDAAATYFASTSALVQLSSSGTVSYLLFNPNSTSANANAAWGVVSTLPIAVPTSTGGTKPTGSGGTGASASATSGSKNGATSVQAEFVTLVLVCLSALLVHNV